MTGISGKVVVVTGAASGIGKATVKRFVDEGATVAMLDLKEESLCESAKSLGLPEGSFFLQPVDITNDDQVVTAVANVRAALGRIDVLCNIAGIGGAVGPVEAQSVADARKVIEVNLLGTYDMIHHVLPIMKDQGEGVILNTASVDGTACYAFEAPYAMSKAAVIHLTQCVANENGGKIRVNCVSPGWVKTPMMSSTADGFGAENFRNESDLVDYGPLGRVEDPSEIAAVFCFLASDEAAVLNGADIHADGGKYLGKQ
jgi:NAD(P)-dependent dehydrogenase (short-subunit alcohol dehydrogenase family)